jgi:hypothetical protein
MKQAIIDTIGLFIGVTGASIIAAVLDVSPLVVIGGVVAACVFVAVVP